MKAGLSYLLVQSNTRVVKKKDLNRFQECFFSTTQFLRVSSLKLVGVALEFLLRTTKGILKIEFVRRESLSRIERNGGKTNNL